MNKQTIKIYKSKKVQIGDIQMNPQSRLAKKSTQSGESLTHAELKDLIARNKLADVIESLIVTFEKTHNPSAANQTILQSTALTRLEVLEKGNLILHEHANSDRAKITNALLEIIDTELKKNT